jgi:hypothetical protein
LSNTETVENRVRKAINRDLIEGPDADPLGDTVYLFFLLKNRIENPFTDQLVDWLNSWIDRVINRSEFGRYVDRELISAVFGYAILSQFNRSKVKVEESQIRRLLEGFQRGGLLFQNLTYTLLLGYADNVLKFKLVSSDQLQQTIADRIEDKSLFNDGKNVAFSCMILSENNSALFDSLLEASYAMIRKGAVPFDERVFYAWILWKYRSRWKKDDLTFIRGYVETSLSNLFEMLEALAENPTDPALTLLFGEDTRRRFSKILLGFALDLAREFEEKTLRLTEQELERAPLIARFGGMALSGLGIYVGVLTVSSLLVSGYLLRQVSRDSTAIITHVSVASAGILFVGILSTLSASLLWDMSVRGIFNDRLILKKALDRTRKFVLEIIAIAILASVIGPILGLG